MLASRTGESTTTVTSATDGGDAAMSHLRDMDLDAFFSDENEPSASGVGSLFNNCKVNIQNFTINIIKN